MRLLARLRHWSLWRQGRNPYGESLDDVIGPMVNRRVVVKVRRDASLKYKFDDIELDE